MRDKLIEILATLDRIGVRGHRDIASMMYVMQELQQLVEQAREEDDHGTDK